MRVLLVLFLLTASVAWATATGCHFNDLSPTSEAWLQTIVRDPAKPLVDAAYPQRLHDSVRLHFRPWFENGGDTTPYLEVLRAQHRVLVSGIDGGQTYGGASRREEDPNSSYRVTPGIFLHEFSMALVPAFAFRWDAHQSQDGNALIEHLRARYRELRGTPAQEPSTKTANPLPPSPVFIVREMPGVSGVFTVTDFHDQYATYTYVSRYGAVKILGEMGRLMTRVRELHARGVADAHRDEIIDLLARYSYLGAHTHPFNGANMSLLMSHVNYVLGSLGLQGIAHGDIDFRAMAHDLPFFTARLRQEILRRNPTATWLAHAVPEETIDSRPDAPLPLVAHYSNIGDVPGLGATDETGNDPNTGIQALRIAAPYLPPGTRLRYFAHVAMIGDVPWVEAGDYVGNRGSGLHLEGIGVAIEGPQADKFEVVYEVNMRDKGWSAPCRNGEFCGTRGESRPINGVRVRIVPKE